MEEISRNTNIDRIDRSLWPSADAIRSSDDFIDAHLLLPGHTDDAWQKIRPVIVRHFAHVPGPGFDVASWADAYRKRFTARLV